MIEKLNFKKRNWSVQQIYFVLLLTFGLFLFNSSITFAAIINVPGKYGSINEAIGASQAGDTILVAVGSYTENIEINKSITLESVYGCNTTMISAVTTNDRAITISADNVIVSGFTITGANIGIYVIPETSNATLLNNRVGMDESNSNYYGIFLDSSHNNTVSNNEFHWNSQYGLVTSFSDNNILTDNLLSSNRRNNLFLWESKNNSITNNTCTGETSDFSTGMAISHESNNNHIENNSCFGIGLGIRIESSHNNNVINNIVENNSTGIEVDHTSLDNKIIDNECINNSSTGIQLWETQRTLVKGNSCSGSIYGIGLQTADNNEIHNNNSFGSATGLALIMSSDSNIIHDNIISQNEQIGVSITDSTNNYIHNNEISSNINTGILMNAETSVSNTILKNSVHDNGIGLYTHNTEDNIIYLNNFSNNLNNNIHTLNTSNIWHSNIELKYSYNDTVFENFLGNFYSDHDLTDSDGNGITDAPFLLSGDVNNDDYPLAASSHNFIITMSDSDLDSDIDGVDLSLFAAKWSNLEKEADLNQDSSINNEDINVFSNSFGNYSSSTLLLTFNPGIERQAMDNVSNMDNLPKLHENKCP